MLNRNLVGVIVVAAVLAITACGDDDNGQTDFTATASPAGQAPGSQAPAGQSPAGQSPAGQSPAGQSPDTGTPGSGDGTRASSSSLDVPVSLSLSSGFQILDDKEHDFTIERRGSPSGPDAYLSVLTPVRVFDPETQGTVDMPADLVGWLTTNPGLKVLDGPTGVTIGGAGGQQIVAQGLDREPYLLLLWMGASGYALAPGETARIAVVRVDGQIVVVAAGAFNLTDYESVLPEIEAMVQTLEFE